MSLINDALRRARQADKKRPAEAGPDSTLKPVENNPPKGGSSFVVLGGSLAVLALGLWFLWQWWSGNKTSEMAALSKTTNKAPVAAKSSLASNLTRPFQAVAKLDAALKDFRQTGETSAPPIQASSTATPQPSETNKIAVTAAPNTNTASLASKSPEPASPVPSAPTNEPAPSVSRSANFQSLHLQGIYFRLTKPSVLINNRTLFVGDEIDGARIVSIERHGVKVEINGTIRELLLN